MHIYPNRALRKERVAAVLGVLLALGQAAPLSAQDVLDRTPNLSGGWVGEPGRLQFNFLHRFTRSSGEERKVSVSPTFFVVAPIISGVQVGGAYASSSIVVPGRPNEWEAFGRARLLRQEQYIVDAAVQVGYNVGPGSVDGELSLARWIGPLRLLVAGRGFSDAYDAGESRFAVAGGAVLRVRDGIALAGDVASLVDREDGEELAWGAGVQLRVPLTPHTLGVHLSNVLTGTLQGASRGSSKARLGFEFTVPLTIARYTGSPVPATPPPAMTTPTTVGNAGEDVVVVEMRNLAYNPGIIEIETGTTIVWRNADAVVHTVTARDGSWNSGNILPSAEWSQRYDSPGRYEIYCIPHPFMTAVVVVR